MTPIPSLKLAMRALVAVALIVDLNTMTLYADTTPPQPSQSWRQPTEGTTYLAHVKSIFEKTYKISSPRILQQHFSGSGLIGDVELFQISRDEKCAPRGCFYALFSHDIGEIPVLTDCNFERVFFAHNHHPDGSKFFAFEFSCGSTFTYVQVSKDHFLINSQSKK
jgi:hypothetical protein